MLCRILVQRKHFQNYLNADGIAVYFDSQQAILYNSGERFASSLCEKQAGHEYACAEQKRTLHSTMPARRTAVPPHAAQHPHTHTQRSA